MKLSRARPVYGVAAALFACAMPGAVAAEEGVDGSTTLEFDVGYLTSRSDTTVRLDSETLGVGTTIDFEDDLGFKSSDSVFKVGASYRFGKSRRHHVDAAFYSLVRTTEFEIDEEIQFGDTIFDINANLKSRFGGEIYKVNYTYLLVQKPGQEFGVSVGAFVASLGASITNLGNSITEAEHITAPLPVIGFRGAHKLTDRLKLVSGGDIFFIDTKKYDGTLFDLRAGLEYEITPRLGIGAHYNFVDMKLGVDSESTHLSAEWKVDGLFAYLKYKI